MARVAAREAAWLAYVCASSGRSSLQGSVPLAKMAARLLLDHALYGGKDDVPVDAAEDVAAAAVSVIRKGRVDPRLLVYAAEGAPRRQAAIEELRCADPATRDKHEVALFAARADEVAGAWQPLALGECGVSTEWVMKPLKCLWVSWTEASLRSDVAMASSTPTAALREGRPRGRYAA